MRVPARVTCVVELDGRRPNPLRHRTLQGRVDHPVGARNCVPRREGVPGHRPRWRGEDREIRRVLLGAQGRGGLRTEILRKVLSEVGRVYQRRRGEWRAREDKVWERRRWLIALAEI